MRLRDFLDFHDSPLASDTDKAHKEFEKRQEICRRLADRLHRLVLHQIDLQYPQLILRDNAFYGYDRADDRVGERFFALVTP